MAAVSGDPGSPDLAPRGGTRRPTTPTVSRSAPPRHPTTSHPDTIARIEKGPGAIAGALSSSLEGPCPSRSRRYSPASSSTGSRKLRQRAYWLSAKGFSSASASSPSASVSPSAASPSSASPSPSVSPSVAGSSMAR